MSDLVLAKSERFGSVQCDFWRNEDAEVFMTSEQLGRALGYETPRESINKLVSRNDYLRQSEFSTEVKMTSVEGEREVERLTRVFSEDGIYEVTFLAKTEKAKEFRAWVRKILKALRKGEAVLVKPTAERISSELEIKAKNAEARLKNATLRQANFLLSEMDKWKNILSTLAVELLTINAFEMIAGQNFLPRPNVEEKFYTATEIGEEAGVSANKVGKLAKANGLKTDEYGITVLDKSPYSVKQVSAFRYNERGRAKLLELLGKEEEGNT